MKKSIKRLAVLVFAGLVLGFSGCRRDVSINTYESTNESTEFSGMVKVSGGKVIGAAYKNNCTGVFDEGRTVTLSDFYMGKYEVTQAEYKEVMQNQKVTVDEVEYTLEAEPSYCTEANKEEYGVDFGTDYGKRPVENVTWYDAIYYCNERSIKEDLEPAYTITVTEVNASNHISKATVTLDGTKNGYRLPSEDEWEYAARGGDPEKADWNYTFSGATTVTETYSDSAYSEHDSALDAVGWYMYNNKTGTTVEELTYEASEYGTHEVGKKEANRLGIYDMSGNVREWCNDYDGYYCTYRGGSWWDPSGKETVSYSYSIYPDDCGKYLGFRVVRNAE